MIEEHKKLAEQIDAAIATARAIELAGGNVQGVLNTLREAQTLTVLRVANYEDGKPAKK